MMSLLTALLHDDSVDLIYFWSSILMVALPLTVFGVLTYLVVKGSLKQKRGTRNSEGT